MSKAEQIAKARELLAESVRYMRSNETEAFSLLSEARDIIASEAATNVRVDATRLLDNLRDGWECRQVDPSVYIGAVAIARHKLSIFQSRLEKAEKPKEVEWVKKPNGCLGPKGPFPPQLNWHTDPATGQLLYSIIWR